MANVMYNPDVLSCIANLSNDEVFTPPEVANAILDMLPQELFKSPDTKFLDPACKTGIFLREIAKRLLVGLEPVIPDLQDRIDHIFHKQLFGIAITELTSHLSRRSLYCSKTANGNYSVSHFDTVDGNVRFKILHHRWKNKKCVFCGASQKQYDRPSELETHAYEFIHTTKPENIFNMKFDVIVGNPPYQLSDGGAQASAKPIYHHFIRQAKKLNPRYMTMIIPARWYAGGKGLDEFRKEMLSDQRFQKLVDVANSSDCFPGVNIAGGICYFLWNRDYKGKCEVSNMAQKEVISTVTRPLDEFKFFVRNNAALPIIHKVLKTKCKTLDQFVLSRNSFSISSKDRGQKNKTKDADVLLLSSEGSYYYPKNKIVDKKKILNKYKVIVTYAMSGGNKPAVEGNYQVVSSLKILKPNEVCTETYLILNTFNTLSQAENMRSYVATKLFRFLLLQALTSIHIKKDCFLFVPVVDFKRSWTDEDLYKKYKLNKKEIKFVESLIKPLDLEEDS